MASDTASLEWRDWAMQRYDTLPRAFWRRLRHGSDEAARIAELGAWSRDFDREMLTLARRIAAARMAEIAVGTGGRGAPSAAGKTDFTNLRAALRQQRDRALYFADGLHAARRNRPDEAGRPKA